MSMAMDIDIQNIGITDVIATICVIGGLVLVGLGIDGIVGMMLTMIVAFYFGNKFKK